MAPTSRPKPSRMKVRKRRERLRKQGLRPIQIWVPDVRSRAFRSEAHRQSLAVAAKTLRRATSRPSLMRYRTGAMNVATPGMDDAGNSRHPS